MREVTYEDALHQLVPKFLIVMWEQKHGVHPVKDYYHYGWLSIIGGAVMIISGIALSLVAFIINPTSYLGYGIPVMLFVTSVVLLITGIKVAIRSGQKGDIARKFFIEVSRLFNELEIEPSIEIGKMSYEEFVANVKDTLETIAKEVDNSVGFFKLPHRARFNQLHSICLEWDLCREKHSYYFPKKDK